MPDEGTERRVKPRCGPATTLATAGGREMAPALRHQLTDHHQHHRGDDHPEDGGDGRGRRSESNGIERASQQRGERRLGQHADHQGDDGVPSWAPES
jgi:hypothetical protein